MSGAGTMSVLDYILALCVFAALVASAVMCAKDAKRRGKSPWLVSLMVFLLFPVGLFAWLALRPKSANTEGR